MRGGPRTRLRRLAFRPCGAAPRRPHHNWAGVPNRPPPVHLARAGPRAKPPARSKPFVVASATAAPSYLLSSPHFVLWLVAELPRLLCTTKAKLPRPSSKGAAVPLARVAGKASVRAARPSEGQQSNSHTPPISNGRGVWCAESLNMAPSCEMPSARTSFKSAANRARDTQGDELAKPSYLRQSLDFGGD